MNKHTPGPWGFLNYKDGESLLSFGVSSKEEMLDRTRTGWYSLWCGIKPEDARLIASAPKLLEALVGCVEHMEWSTDQGQSACLTALAAIAEATGAA